MPVPTSTEGEQGWEPGGAPAGHVHETSPALTLHPHRSPSRSPLELPELEPLEPPEPDPLELPELEPLPLPVLEPLELPDVVLPEPAPEPEPAGPAGPLRAAIVVRGDLPHAPQVRAARDAPQQRERRGQRRRAHHHRASRRSPVPWACTLAVTGAPGLGAVR